METSDWIAALAVVVAVLAVWVAALSYAETKRTADANVAMAEAARESAKSAASSADEAKRANDLLEAQYQLTKESVEIDRTTAEYQRLVDMQARMANVVLTSHQGRRLWVSKTGDGFGKIGVRVKREGRALARDVCLEVYRNGKRSPVERGQVSILGDEPVMLLFHARWKEGRLPVETDIYELRLTYRDDLDTHTFSSCYQFTGGECPNWTAVEVDCPSDGNDERAA